MNILCVIIRRAACAHFLKGHIGAAPLTVLRTSDDLHSYVLTLKISIITLQSLSLFHQASTVVLKIIVINDFEYSNNTLKVRIDFQLETNGYCFITLKKVNYLIGKRSKMMTGKTIFR